MVWQTQEFGSSHAGRAAAVLPDGSEPKPVYFDAGSTGSSGQYSSDWWIYNGTFHAPVASALRAACSCGWRGTRSHPIDWTRVEEEGHHDRSHTAGPAQDWDGHINDVEARLVPLPCEVDTLLQNLEQQLDALAGDAPLAALRAVAALERIVKGTGYLAAFAVHADEVPTEEVGQALGMTANEADSQLLR